MRVELSGVKKIYSNKTVLDIDMLSLDSGKIYAILGANGSGKTTLLRMLAGFDKDYIGMIRYDGIKKVDNSYIAHMPQNSYMFDFTVLKNVMLGIEGNGTRDIDKHTNGIHNRDKQSSDNQSKDVKNIDIRNRAIQALTSVGMEGFLNAKAHSLSGGEAQRVALARTLVLERKLVLLDEPASATDILGIELVEKYIKSVNRNNGSTIIFTTHNPTQAAHIADEVIMMHFGKVLEKGSPSDVFEAPRCQETRNFLRNWRI